MIIYSKTIIKILTFGFARAITIFPFIFLKYDFDKGNPVIINHEKIHIKQQLELGVIFFFILYLLFYAVNLVVYRNHCKAYRNILFEKEAYSNEGNLLYLSQRKRFAYFRKKSKKNE